MVDEMENIANSDERGFDRLDGRRILFFLGQVHHYRKLSPLLDAFEELGANIIYSTTQNLNFGCDFKGDFEVPLREAGKEILFLPEQFEMEIAPQFVKVYRRWEKAIARAASETPTWSQNFAVSSLRLRTMLILEHDMLVEKLLDLVEPELIVVLHEYNWWTRIVCAQAIKRNIPVLSSMRGLPYKFNPPVKQDCKYSTRVWLWGKTQYDKLIADGSDPKKLVITGPVHLDTFRRQFAGKGTELRKEFGLPTDKKILLVIMPRIQSLHAGKEMLSSLAEYVNKHSDMMLVIKWHMYQRADEIDQLKPPANDIRTFQYENIYRLMACCDIGICSGTSAGGELLAFDKPLIEVNWEGKSVNINYANTGAAVEVKTQTDWPVIEKILKEGLTTTQKQAIEKFIEDNFYRLDGKCTERVLREAISLLP